MMRFLLCLALLAPLEAPAAEKILFNYGPVFGESEREAAELNGVPTYSREECLSLLPSILAPEAVIKDGLTVLDIISSSAPAPACLAELVENWGSHFPPNPNPNQAHANILFERIAFLNARRIELEARLACLNPHKEKTLDFSTYEQTNATQCEGRWLNSAQAKQIASEVKILEAQQDKLRNENDAHGQNEAILSETYAPALADEADRNALRELLSRGSIAPTSLAGELLRAAEDARQPSGTARWKKAMARLKELTPKVQAAVKTWQKESAGRKAEGLTHAAMRRKERESEYGIRRLLASYQRFTAANPKGETLANFCAENEKDQQKDLAYAKAMGGITPIYRDGDWDFFRRFGLGERDLTAIRNYTDSYYQTINSEIWKARSGLVKLPLKEKHELYVNTLNDAIAKLPRYPGPVKRFGKLPKEVLAEHRPGGVVTYEAFTSTSRKTDWAWESGESHSFVIYGKSGGDISKISTNSDEQEVLFPAGTHFKVLSRKPRGDGSENYDFVLAEVDASGNVIAELPK